MARFQSTHPVWGATAGIEEVVSSHTDFNPRTPCGVRPARKIQSDSAHAISIHAPRVGCDQDVVGLALEAVISIHAPRVGCDI